MRRGLEGGAKRDPMHDSSAVAAGVCGWPGVGRTATAEAASGRRGTVLDRQRTSDVPAGQAPGGGWRGAGTAGASGEGWLTGSDVAARRPAGRGLGEQAPERPRAVYGAESLHARYQRRAARGAPGRGLGAVSPKGGASGEVRRRCSMASAVRAGGWPGGEAAWP